MDEDWNDRRGSLLSRRRYQSSPILDFKESCPLRISKIFTSYIKPVCHCTGSNFCVIRDFDLRPLMLPSMGPNLGVISTLVSIPSSKPFFSFLSFPFFFFFFFCIPKLYPPWPLSSKQESKKVEAKAKRSKPSDESQSRKIDPNMIQLQGFGMNV
ncbi:hypothetical protein BD289DRAFT_204019 [Coniella lustricola]|uniref:Uncharacterized protein n=1 Tax=Coniella lustricola TaxID=2025994 RepID=A0A2T3ACB7_9PEZI|nr:hypothetical protein BD289DRAFT_204019 [Coniella lustricola]